MKLTVVVLVGWVAAMGLVLLPVPAIGTAQEASPIAAHDSPSPFDDLPGLRATAGRLFVATTVRPPTSLALAFVAAEFDTPEHASAGISIFFEEVSQGIAEGGLTADFRAVNGRQWGDETVARAGNILLANPIDGIDELTAAVLVVRTGRILLCMAGAGVEVNPLYDLSTVAGAVIDRVLGPAATPIGADGRRAGGLWDVLPVPADLPDGFVLDREFVPTAALPLPAEATPIP